MSRMTRQRNLRVGVGQIPRVREGRPGHASRGAGATGDGGRQSGDDLGEGSEMEMDHAADRVMVVEEIAVGGEGAEAGRALELFVACLKAPAATLVARGRRFLWHPASSRGGGCSSTGTGGGERAGAAIRRRTAGLPAPGSTGRR